MNCETVKKLSQDYLERRLAQLDRNEFLRHIDECASCERELVNYRDVFTFLGAMKSVEPPRGFQNSIISQLKSEGVVHQPHITRVRSWARGFFGLPAAAKYPLAAVIVVAALYLPLRLAFSLAGEAAGKATVIFTDWLLSMWETVGEASYLMHLWDTLAGYGRALSTVLSAVSSLVLSSTGGLWIAGAGAAVALSAILVITRIVRKRSSHNAPLCL